MARSKKPVEEFSFLEIKVQDYEASIGARINYEARNRRTQDDGVRLYQFDSKLELAGVCISSEDRAGHSFRFTIYGGQRGVNARYHSTIFSNPISAFSGRPIFATMSCDTCHRGFR